MHEILYKNVNAEILPADINEVNNLIKDENNLVWIDIELPPEVWPDDEELFLLKRVLNLHPLNIEDCVSDYHQPKVEEFSDHLFTIINSINITDKDKIKISGIGIFIGKNFIVSYRTESVPEIESIKNSFKTGSNHQFTNPIDIFHTICDHIVDSYIPIIDNFDFQIDKLESKMFKTIDTTKIMQKLISIRDDLNKIRITLVIEKEIFYNITRGYYSLITNGELTRFRDIYDHIDKYLSLIDNQKDSISGILSIQLNLSSQRLNEIIKFLTMISTILLPASLISGIFGMNFLKMPLFETSYGFTFAIGLMLLIAIVMIIYFKHKKWI